MTDDLVTCHLPWMSYTWSLDDLMTDDFGTNYFKTESYPKFVSNDCRLNDTLTLKGVVNVIISKNRSVSVPPVSQVLVSVHALIYDIILE